MKEQDIEDIVAKYPSVIEEGLVLRGRQVNVKGKYIDLLFEDRFGQKLIVELKRGAIIREHVGQIMDYEGHLLSPDDPNVRVMLIGNRVPENLRRSLEHHGFEWKELSFTFLSDFLQERNEFDLLKKIPTSEPQNSSITEKSERKSMDNPLISKERTSFWEQLLTKVKSQIPLNFPAPSKPQAVYASAGKTGMKWAFAVKKNESWVELEIMLPGEQIKSHRIFSSLFASKNEIERKYGHQLKWEKIELRKSCRIQTTPREKYGVDDDRNWNELQETLIGKMKKMVEVFNPYIQQL
jgi:hypothetical protein